MFDVASGECELVDFLLTRFDPIDLKQKIRFDPSAQVDEQINQPKEAEEAPIVASQPKPEPEPVSVQLNLKMPPPPGSQPEATDPDDGYKPAAIAAGTSPDDTLETAEEEEVQEVQEVQEQHQEVKKEAPVSTPMGPDWLTLLHQRFQEAAQRYQEELAPAESEEDEPA